MAGKTFRLDIVTPRKVVYSGDVVSFSAPGVLGGFQILYNHAPMLAAIGIGEAKLLDTEGKEYRYATSGGFVDVFRNRVTVLAETAERADEIDVARAEDAQGRASQRLGHHDPQIDTVRAQHASKRAVNRLKIARKGL